MTLTRLVRKPHLAITILATKLHFPQARPNLAPRPRLTAMIERGIQGALTLISANAGSGKTTLMSEWRAGPGRDKRTIWISLDAADNDPFQFLNYLAVAIDSVSPKLVDSTLSLLQSVEPPPLDVIVVSLLEALNSLDADTVLVLDDYHVIANFLIHETLNKILAHLSPALHLVVLTRADPPLPLARLRVRNQLTEIRANDLRFSLDEAAAFLSQTMGLSLTAEQIASLEARTEGWIAGLQLAALSLQRRGDAGEFVAAFTGSHRYVGDYLVEEVLRLQTKKRQDFLLKTSILERMNASLCNALTDESNGQAMIEELEQSNLFVIGLDDSRQWYRYHRLFADVLQNRLARTYPDALPELHRRAADWLEENKFLFEALQHALAGKDKPRAASLAEQANAQMLVRGELANMLHWLKAVDDFIAERPLLCIQKAWALLLTGQPADVEAYLTQAERLLSAHILDDETYSMRGDIVAIRCFSAARSGNAALALELGHQALQILPESNLGVRGAAYLAMGGANILRGDYPSAFHFMQEASRLGQQAGNLNVAVTALSSMANLLTNMGKLFQADEMYRTALSITSANGQALPMAARVHSGMTRLSYEWNDLDATQEHVRQAYEFGKKWGNADTLVTSQVMQARIHQARGDEHAANEVMRTVDELVRTRRLTATGPGWVDTSRVWLWLAQGNLEACNRWVNAHPNVPLERSAGDEGERLILARILISQGKPVEALKRLDVLIHENEVVGFIGNVIELLAFQALALQQKGDQSAALKSLLRALTLAEPEGYIRVFVDQGKPLQELLKKIKSEGQVKKYVHRLLVSFGGESAPGSQPLIEPLSERELEILRLVAAGKSNQEIADELILSVGTVKKHISNIFQKLNTESRTRCIAMARELNLLG